MLKFPYGISDFYKLITNNYFYVDRTDHIRLIENFGEQLLFLRPRRFGKSLLLSMLENYYDVAKTDEFDRLFGHLAIGQNPTPKHNQYLVMKWDFSEISPVGNAEQIQQAIYDHINGCIEQFIAHYQDRLNYEIVLEPTNAVRSFQSVLAAISLTPYRLYLLIDEYDNFANEVLMSSQPLSQNRYQALLSGEGAFKALFKAVKSASSGQGLDRVFITGVSPVVLSDITSGYNVAENIYLQHPFNDLCGFQEHEITAALTQIAQQCDFPEERVTEALKIMRTFYNGYCFNYQKLPKIYNPTLALYFMKTFQRDCQYPEDMLDDNLAMDKDKISYISALPDGKSLIVNALNGEPPLTVLKLALRFGVKDMLTVDKDTTFMLSLLYYFGVLTLGGTNEVGKRILQIPNLVVRQLYMERIKEMLLPDNLDKKESLRVADILYQTGDLQPLCDFIEQRYFNVFDNRDYAWANELTIKTVFLTVLFDEQRYMIESETPLARNYADLTLIVRPGMRQYQLLDILIEFKYVNLKKAKLDKVKIKQLSIEELKALPIIQKKITEATTQVQDYQKALETAYKGELRLRVYTVIALGFERLVWL